MTQSVKYFLASTKTGVQSPEPPYINKSQNGVTVCAYHLSLGGEMETDGSPELMHQLDYLLDKF